MLADIMLASVLGLWQVAADMNGVSFVQIRAQLSTAGSLNSYCATVQNQGTHLPVSMNAVSVNGEPIVGGDCLSYEDLRNEFNEFGFSFDSLGLLETRPHHVLKHRKPMIWVHVHKNAGTTMCALAKFNGEKIVSPSINCNWANVDGFDVMNASRDSVSCQTRADTFARNGWTWAQIEREIDKDDICDGFMYGIMLRDPVKHVVSFADANHIPLQSVVECLRSRTDACEETILKVRFTRGTERWVVFDNYLVRTLLGKNGLMIPFGSVNEEHAQQAIRILSKFDVVTLVEEFDDATPKILAEALGWKTTNTEQNVNLKSKSNLENLSDADREYIKERTKMDSMVYDFFKHRHMKMNHGV